MFELVYKSTARKDLTEIDIANILEYSREYNSNNDISGCLIYHNQTFIQILEGGEKVIENLFEKIIGDKRHSGVQLLHQAEIESRMFESWGMAYIDLNSTYAKNSERHLFKMNFVVNANLADKSNEASKLFWENSKSLFLKN